MVARKRPGIQPTLFRPTLIATHELWWEADMAPAKGTVIDRAVDPWVYTTLPNPAATGGTFGNAGAARPAYAHIESRGVSRRTAAFDGAALYHVSSLAVGSWPFLHQVCTVHAVVLPDLNATLNNAVLSTSGLPGGTTGLNLYYDAANEQFVVKVTRGAAPAVFDVNTGAGSAPPGSVYRITVRMDAAAAPDYDLRLEGVSVASGAFGAAVSGANPDFTAHIGRLASAASNFFEGVILSVTAYSSYLALADVEYLELQSALKYQNNAVALQNYPTFWFRGDLRPQPDVGSDVDVEFWYDHAGHAHRAYQTTAANMGDLRRVDALFDDQASIESDGVNDSMLVSPGIGWPAGTDHTCIGVLSEDVLSNTQFLLDFQTGRMVFTTRSGVAGPPQNFGIFDTAYRDAAAAVLGPQVLEWHVDDSANTLDVYRAGVFAGQVATAAGGVAPGGTVRLFSQFGGAAAPFDGRDAELWYRDSLLTGANLGAYREELFGRYPQTWGVVPGGEAWWDPLTEANVTMDGANRISAVADSNERGNTETQGAAADQPLWVADAGDGYAAIEFDPLNTEYLNTGVVASAAEGSIWGWFNKDSAVGGQIPMGSADAADTCAIAAQAGGNWFGEIGGSSIDSGLAVAGATWVFVALTWDGTDETVYANGTWATQAVGETASTRALVVGAADNNGAIGQYWNGFVGEHGVSDHALSPYEVARLRRQTTRGGDRDTWLAAIIPDHELWCNPNWGEVVTRIAGDRVTQVDDGHATPGSGAQNNETQGVAADRPIWVASGGAGDGVGALRFVIAGTEHLLTGVAANTTDGTMWCWCYLTSLVGANKTPMGSRDGAGNSCLFRVDNAGQLRFAYAGGAQNHPGAFSAGAWHFICATWNATERTITLDGTIQTAAGATTVGTRVLAIGARDDNGAPDQYWGGDVGEHGIVNRAISAAEITRLYAMTART